MQAVTPMIIKGFSLGVLFAICAANNNMICGFMFVNWTQIESKKLIFTTISEALNGCEHIVKNYKVKSK